MSDDIIIYESGVRIGNKYSKFIESRNENDVDDYIEIMKTCCSNGDIVKYQNIYRCISVTPMLVIELEAPK